MKSGRGGPRRGAGQKPKPEDEVRSERVVIMVTPPELEKLQQLADEQDLPLGTTAYELLARALRRR